MKVTLALTTWTEHPALIGGQKRTVTLNEYAQRMPAVEIDTFFYALPNVNTVQKWVGQVSPEFQFIVKAHQSMTKHPQAQLPAGVANLAAVFQRFKTAVTPLIATGQLKTNLFQFPPSFVPTVANIDYLMKIRQLMGDLPIAIELRNQAWYRSGVLKSLVDYCRELHYTLVAADEAQSTQASVPFYLVTTNPQLALLRLHGRNQAGWRNPGKSWRKQRTLYRYSDQELAEFQQQIEQLTPAPQEVCVIFNNNSAGDAAPNALRLQAMMGLHFAGLVPRNPEQLNLF